MSTELKPVKLDASKRVIPENVQRRVAWWRVTLGKRVTGTKKQRRFFKTYKQARQFLDGSLAARVVQGNEAFSIPQKLRVEAMLCAKRLEPFAVSLTAAVDYFVRHARPEGGLRTFEALSKEFLTSRRSMSCKPKTLTQYESYLKIIGEEFGKLRVNEMKSADIEDWLAESDWSPRTRKNYLVTLTTIFNFAIARGYCITNPAARLERPILDDKPPGLLTTAQALKLLNLASAQAPEMVAGIAISLFAGLRRSEICALDWCEVDLKTRTIEVKGTKAKTRQRRIVTIPDNLALWLEDVAKENGPVTLDVDGFGEKLKTLSVAAKINPWPHNACRHSFGSYFYAKHKNENLTAAEMGNSPAIVHKHYKAVVKEKDAIQYFEIRPGLQQEDDNQNMPDQSSVPDNVVPLSAFSEANFPLESQ